MIKIFSTYNYQVEEDVNKWLTENLEKIEVTKISQSTCFSDSSRNIYVTVMIEYFELS
jgi:hypothetical protein